MRMAGQAGLGDYLQYLSLIGPAATGAYSTYDWFSGPAHGLNSGEIPLNVLIGLLPTLGYVGGSVAGGLAARHTPQASNETTLAESAYQAAKQRLRQAQQPTRVERMMDALDNWNREDIVARSSPHPMEGGMFDGRKAIALSDVPVAREVASRLHGLATAARADAAPHEKARQTTIQAEQRLTEEARTRFMQAQENQDALRMQRYARYIPIGAAIGGVLGAIPAISMMRDQPEPAATMQPRV